MLKIAFSLALFALLASGCSEVIYEKSVEAEGNETFLQFQLDDDYEEYEISVMFDYDCSEPREDIKARLESPSGELYGTSSTIGEMRIEDCAVTTRHILPLEKVAHEDGDFNLTLYHRLESNDVNDIRVRAQIPDENVEKLLDFIR